MQQSLVIRLGDEKITITSRDGQLITSAIPAVAVDGKEKILCFGETQETFQKKSPTEWERIKKKANFFNPFPIDAFHPKLAGAFINYLAHSSLSKSTETQNQDEKDLIELQILIPDYEKLSQNIQELFEYYIQKAGFVNLNGLSINGQAKAIDLLEQAQQAERKLKQNYPITTTITFLLALLFADRIFGEKFHAPIPREYTFFVLGGVILAGTVVGIIAGFVSIMTWKASVKNSVSPVISNAIIEDANILPKSMVKFLQQNFFLSKSGG